jgi:uncharacterized protein
VPWYVDTSAFIKLVVLEDRSAELTAWVRSEEDRSGRLFSSDLLRTEAIRAARRISNSVVARAHDKLGDVLLISLPVDVFRHAGQLNPAVLRSLDALHLAAAMSIGDDLTGVVTYDFRMAEAARSLGIPTAAP